jgi:hypothetical protein
MIGIATKTSIDTPLTLIGTIHTHLQGAYWVAKTKAKRRKGAALFDS